MVDWACDLRGLRFGFLDAAQHAMRKFFRDSIYGVYGVIVIAVLIIAGIWFGYSTWDWVYEWFAQPVVSMTLGELTITFIILRAIIK